jgi:hypothetical protein
VSALEWLLRPSADNAILAGIDSTGSKKVAPTRYASSHRYSQRMPIIHLKDMAEDGSESFAEVGEELMTSCPSCAGVKANGIEWYAVEQTPAPAIRSTVSTPA